MTPTRFAPARTSKEAGPFGVMKLSAALIGSLWVLTLDAHGRTFLAVGQDMRAAAQALAAMVQS